MANIELSYLCAPDFPLRFTSKSDLEFANNDQAVKNNINLSIMVVIGSIPLMGHLGSVVTLMPFDPNDNITLAMISQECVRASSVGEPRAVVDSSIIAMESEDHIASLIIPYSIPLREEWMTLEVSMDTE